MNNNVVIAVFEVESEAYQAFTQLKSATVGKDYTAPEAALIKNTNNNIEICDAYGSTDPSADTATGIIIGSLIGLLGGPIGVILGGSLGAWAGSVSDENRAVDTASSVAVIADKIFEGEIAIAAVVREEEPAFDAVFADYKTTIIRYDAADIADDVDRLYDLGAEISNQVIQEAKADRKEERADKREARREKMKAQFEEYEAATNRSLGIE